MTAPIIERARNFLSDNNPLYFGDDLIAKFIYETADANANLLELIFPEGGAVDVPGLVIGDASIDNVDLTWFNGLTEPFIAIVNDAADAYVRLDAGDDAVAGSKGIYFKAAADEDIELINLSVTGLPRVFWDESESAFALNTNTLISLAGGALGFYLTNWLADNLAMTIRLRHSGSSTADTFTAITSTWGLGALRFYGSDGTDWQEACSIYSRATGTIGDNRVPGEIDFYCYSDEVASAETEVFHITALGLYMPDDIPMFWGGVSKIRYETADANANALVFTAQEGGVTDVPLFIFGDASIDNVDLGWFNGVTEPTIAVANDAADAYVSLDAGDDAVAGSKGLYFKAAADEDHEIINSSVTGTPRVYWDESEDQFRSTKGWLFDAAVVIDTTATYAGLLIKSTQDGTGPAQLDLRVVSASPLADDILGYIRFSGRDSAANEQFYGSVEVDIVDPTSTSEDSQFQIQLIDAGTANYGLKLTGPGVLSVDLAGGGAAAQVDLFDDYDDALILRQTIQQRNREVGVKLGLFYEKDTGSGYMMNIQPMIKLLAGAAYQTRQMLEDTRDELDRRLEALETKLLKAGG